MALTFALAIPKPIEIRDQVIRHREETILLEGSFAEAERGLAVESRQCTPSQRIVLQRLE